MAKDKIPRVGEFTGWGLGVGAWGWGGERQLHERRGVGWMRDSYKNEGGGRGGGDEKVGGG